ncbi:GntR family transcriptional regulator [Pseudooceanicola sp. CBS1P-1]|uniref:FCD domain-containing protein n=1 Tax=Pseudooceanicola albus TaxID=2692189 RepID=A0A6L7G7Z3_9RHOB|nr:MULTISPECIES: GntR family transcriptional regulator [Pseudooceanicola]MBT9382885.1 GntR family transcriptional regulator [Pseudooceanicola endophyticus]MXN20191.1 FCD domain-containing protein [Pseudooceanicola albus]
MAGGIQEISSDRVATELADAIHAHRIAPGTKLNEDEVGTIFGVSRTVARAALQSLAHMRLVDRRPNRGAYVAHPGPTEAIEVLEARALLEASTARAAALRMSDADAGALRALIAEEHAAEAEGNHGRGVYLCGQFHLEIARISGKETLRELLEQLVARSSLIMAIYGRGSTAGCVNAPHHRLVDALAAGDADRAEWLMVEHLQTLISSLDLDRRTRPLSLKEALVP